MAVLTTKPLNLAQKIRRRIFKGSPNIFADVDINNQSEISDYNYQKLHQKVGVVLEHSSLTVSFSTGGGFIGANVSLVSGAIAYVNGVQFSLPTLTGVSYTHAFSGVPDDDVFTLYLVAEKFTTNFASDPSIAGVTGSGLPSPLPSSDAVRYRNERIAGTWGTNNPPSLGSGEEVICILGQGLWTDDVVQTKPEWVQTAVEIGDLSTWDFPQQTFIPEDIPTNTLTYTGASEENGLIGKLAIAFYSLKKVLISYHSWMRTGIFTYLPTLPYKWTQLQEFSQGSDINITSSASTVLLIPTNGNVFKIYWTGVSNHRITDIKKVGNVTIANGAVIYLFCSQSSPLNNGFLVNSSGSLRTSDYEMEDPFNGVSTSDMVITVNSSANYSATSYGSINIIKAIKVDGYWILMRANRDHEILNYAQDIYSELSAVRAVPSWRIIGSTLYPFASANISGNLQYRKDGLGDVIIEGGFTFASPAGTNTIIYQLPTLYRPSIDLRIPMFSLDSVPTVADLHVLQIQASTGYMQVITNSAVNHTFLFAPFRYRGV